MNDTAQVTACFSPARAGALQIPLAKLDTYVDGFCEEVLHPRMVDEILGISPAERRRWIKDGRLPVSGAGSFRRGKQSIPLPLHPPRAIAALASSGDLIAAWRAADAATGPSDKTGP